MTILDRPTNGSTPHDLLATAGSSDSEAPTDLAFRGYVLGTEQESSSPLGFSVFVAPDRYLQLDDVVSVRTALPDGRAIDIYGVVDEVSARHEGVQLTSDVALVREGILPAEPVVSAHVAVTRVDPEIYVPPMPGAVVRLADGEARNRALFFDSMERRFPFGLARGDLAEVEAVHGNLDFLDGRKGAHVNISGISGVATKTSYATYLLYALFEGERLGDLTTNARALIFNVKGEDLLFLDRPNKRLDEDPDLRRTYDALDLPARPFGSVGFFAPVRHGDQPLPDTGSRSDGVTGFFWTLREFCERGYLRFLFVDADTEQTQIAGLVDTVTAHLRAEARKSASDRISIDGVEATTFDELVDAIEAHLDTDPDSLVPSWAGRGYGQASVGTIRAFMRRLQTASRHLGHLVRSSAFGDPRAHRIERSHQITVVDLHRLHDRAQRFVVGVLLAELLEEREALGAAEHAPPVFVVVDELNKYAPRDGHSPIKETLLDIAERGRSLGVILIGAQQTASEVEQRIVANSSFRVVGRLDTAEAQRSEYRFLGPTWRQRATLLTPGSMIVQQPEIPVPLLIRFPHPSWATRKSEVASGAIAAAPGGERDIMARFDDVPALD
ncbi:MAG: ATP-binding protein [Chloroflexi bacterium]|nr:ATP-binding protein [Chloroflexota bacterium]MDA1145864.1 ATP-binding protein [Chloroflexota bacterium]